VKTGRILNIMVTTAAQADVPRLLNYLTAPQVVRSTTPRLFELTDVVC